VKRDLLTITAVVFIVVLCSMNRARAGGLELPFDGLPKAELFFDISDGRANWTLRIIPGGTQQRVQACRPDWSENGAAAVFKVPGDAPLTYAVLRGAAAVVEIR
jgi:hypothetical protein